MSETIPAPDYTRESFTIGEQVYWWFDGFGSHVAVATIKAIHPKTVTVEVTVKLGIVYTDGTVETKTYTKRPYFGAVLRRKDVPQEWHEAWDARCEEAQSQLRSYLEHRWGF